MVETSSYPIPSFMEQLSEEVRAKVLNAGTIVHYQNGQLIHNRGDDKPGISIVVSGMVQVGIMGVDGSFIVVSRLGIGETFGEFTLFAGLPRTHDIFASGDAKVNQIAASTFLRLYDSEPEISRALLTSTLIRTHLLLELTDATRRLSIRGRTAMMLLMHFHTNRGENSFAYTQSDLAIALGVSRTSLNKALNELSDLGLIKKSYGRITILQPEKLRLWLTSTSQAL